MPVETLLVASVELLALGMGAVFVILSLMIACMTILCRCAPEEEAKPVPHPSASMVCFTPSSQRLTLRSTRFRWR